VCALCHISLLSLIIPQSVRRSNVSTSLGSGHNYISGRLSSRRLSGISRVLSFAVLSVRLRCCLFLYTCPLGVDTTYDLRVLTLGTILPLFGCCQFLPTLMNYQVKCRLLLHGVDDHSSFSEYFWSPYPFIENLVGSAIVKSTGWLSMICQSLPSFPSTTLQDCNCTMVVQ